MFDIMSLASSGLAFFVVAVSPGPATISNATIAMSQGRKPSLVYGTGLSCGLVFWGIIAATGMGAVLQGSVYLLMVLKILGGLYLLWLAYKTGLSAWKPGPDSTVNTGHHHLFYKGLLLNLSNPKSVIAWMAALSVGLRADATVLEVAAATLTCILVGFFTNGLYSVLFSIDGMMRAYRRVRRKVNAVVALLFTVAGLGLIRSALHD